ncbi:hypothetical protein [Methylocella tundrae]|nr:hypothetical protein [Methylocella tundrae]
MLRAVQAASSTHTIGNEGGETGFIVWPAINGYLVAAMGIAATTPFLSIFLLRRKYEGNPPKAEGSGFVESFKQMWSGATAGLDVKSTIKDASLADLFFGEEAANQDRIDVTRFQQVVMTAGLVVSYVQLLVAYAGDISPFDVFDAFPRGSSLLPAMPDVSGTFVGLLVATNSTYLVAKAAVKEETPPKG